MQFISTTATNFSVTVTSHDLRVGEQCVHGLGVVLLGDVVQCRALIDVDTVNIGLGLLSCLDVLYNIILKPEIPNMQ